MDTLHLLFSSRWNEGSTSPCRYSHPSISRLPSRLWGWGGVGAITSMATPPESPHAALMRDTSLQYEDAIIPELDIYAIPSKEGIPYPGVSPGPDSGHTANAKYLFLRYSS